MENSKVSCTWWCNSRGSSDHHQWLLASLSEVHTNITEILKLMQQEDGDTFMRESEANCQKKTELHKRVEDIYRSYYSLAEYWGGSGGIQIHPSQLNQEARIRSRLEDFLADSSSLEDDQSTVTEEAEKIKSSNNDPEPGFDMASWLEQRISCSEKMSRIAKDVLSELARRNTEKREANRVLQCQVERMMEEGRALRLENDRLTSENGALHLKLNKLMEDGKNLQNSSRCSSIIKKQRRSNFSRFKSLFF